VFEGINNKEGQKVYKGAKIHDFVIARKPNSSNDANTTLNNSLKSCFSGL
jgi:hypothetical protein